MPPAEIRDSCISAPNRQLCTTKVTSRNNSTFYHSLQAEPEEKVIQIEIWFRSLNQVSWFCTVVWGGWCWLCTLWRGCRAESPEVARAWALPSQERNNEKSLSILQHWCYREKMMKEQICTFRVKVAAFLPHRQTYPNTACPPPEEIVFRGETVNTERPKRQVRRFRRKQALMRKLSQLLRKLKIFSILAWMKISRF